MWCVEAVITNCSDWLDDKGHEFPAPRNETLGERFRPSGGLSFYRGTLWSFWRVAVRSPKTINANSSLAIRHYIKPVGTYD